jgi:hypothetical protein
MKEIFVRIRGLETTLQTAKARTPGIDPQGDQLVATLSDVTTGAVDVSSRYQPAAAKPLIEAKLAEGDRVVAELIHHRPTMDAIGRIEAGGETFWRNYNVQPHDIDFIRRQLEKLQPMERDGAVRRADDARVIVAVRTIAQSFGFVSEPALKGGERRAWAAANPEQAAELARLNAFANALRMVGEMGASVMRDLWGRVGAPAVSV